MNYLPIQIVIRTPVRKDWFQRFPFHIFLLDWFLTACMQAITNLCFCKFHLKHQWNKY